MTGSCTHWALCRPSQRRPFGLPEPGCTAWHTVCTREGLEACSGLLGKNSWSTGLERRCSFQGAHPLGSVNSVLCEEGHNWTRATVMPSEAWGTRGRACCPGVRKLWRVGGRTGNMKVGTWLRRGPWGWEWAAESLKLCLESCEPFSPRARWELQPTLANGGGRGAH